ncbi:unnamed protein product [Microthlaspi erraticum]|uniref:Arabidopsis retrotransposon Orf1 C-terminal domain-containing protein n=1 Tax=Microthlaspi erraticum TaxID=1685480 RepID=A0A6D2KY82_9BRAS|nr:unnamed protein product [Microthlaspi erraticum]
MMSSIELSWTKAGMDHVLGKGRKKMVTFRQLEILFGSKAAQIRSPVLRYVTSLANTFFARKPLGQSMKEKSSSLTWESSPSSHAQGWEEDQRRQGTQEFMPLLDQLSPKTTAYNTHQKGRKLSVGGIITPILVQLVSVNKKKATPAGWMDIKFCKTNLLIDHKEVDGRYQFKFTHPTAGPFQASPAQP